MESNEGTISNELYNELNSFIISFDVEGVKLTELVSISTIKDDVYIFCCLAEKEANDNIYTVDIHMTSDVFNDILEDSNPTHYEIKEETVDSEYVELIKKPIGNIVLNDL